MPDPVLIFKAVAAAGGAAALILLAFGWPWKAAPPIRADLGATIGVGAGFFIGCLILGLKPHWPPLEDVDRWLFCLLPAVTLAESVAALVGNTRWIAWLARGIVA